MLLTQMVIIRWHPPMREHYISKGYLFTKHGDYFEVNINDLAPNSQTVVEVLCDYCKKTIMNKSYGEYLNNHKKGNLNKDCCKKCSPIKQKEISLLQNGYEHHSSQQYHRNYFSELKREPFENVEKLFLEKNLILLSKKEDYKNRDSLLKYICLKHEEKGMQETCYGNLKRGCACVYCKNEKIGNALRFNIDTVIESFENKGLQLLDFEYENASQKLRYICSKHPNIIQEATLALVRVAKYVCPFCAIENSKYKNNPRWNGLNNLKYYLRGCINDWKSKSLQLYNYKCAITEEKRKLEIHHLHPFIEIVKETLEITKLPLYEKVDDYTFDELVLLRNTCIDLHEKYGPGIPIKQKIHKFFHKTYGFFNNNIEQFLEFVENNYNKNFISKDEVFL